MKVTVVGAGAVGATFKCASRLYLSMSVFENESKKLLLDFFSKKRK